MLLSFVCILVMSERGDFIGANVYSSTLQKVIYDEGKRCLLVKVHYNCTRLRSGDFFRDRVSDVRLIVLDRGLEYASAKVVFELECAGFTTGLTSAGVPKPERGFIATEPLCLLPTARLVQHQTGSYLVVFDGTRGQVYFKARQERTAKGAGDMFKKVDRITVADRKVLSDLFATSFDPCDMYWDYFLVALPGFFGYQSNSDLKNRGISGISTDLLYQRWKQSTKLVP